MSAPPHLCPYCRGEWGHYHDECRTRLMQQRDRLAAALRACVAVIEDANDGMGSNAHTGGCALLKEQTAECDCGNWKATREADAALAEVPP